MRHVQLTVATFSIGPRPLPLRHGTVQIVERVGGRADGTLDWEVVLHTIEREPVAPAVHQVAFDVITGADDDGRLLLATFAGPAMLVRTHEQSIVLRGDGALDGFDRGLLTEG